MPVPDIGYCATLGRPLNFDGGTLEGMGYSEGTTLPAVSTEQAVSGTRSMKCTIPSGTSTGRSFSTYNNAANSGSQEYADGTEAWFAFDLYTSDLSSWTGYNQFMQWTEGGTGGTSGIYLRPNSAATSWDLVYNGGGASTTSIATLTQDVWEHWLIHIKFNQVNTIGEINVWHKGTQVVTAVKPSNGTWDEALGLFDWRVGFNRADTLTTLQTAYFDNIAVGTTRDKVEDMGSTAVTYSRRLVIG